MKHNLSPFLISSILVCAAAAALVAQGGTAEPVSCADHSIVASAVRTTEDVQAFVQCAYEFVQKVGFEEARRAFHEDERWRSGPIYVVVTEVAHMPEMARAFVFPPDPSQEGLPWGPLVDVFGSDYSVELHRIVNSFSDGWFYYSTINPATGRKEPKASYFKSIDWAGTPAAIVAGIYRRDLPGTCESEEVHAMGLEADPSPERLQEFVRCAALELESKGFFATRALSSDPRWRNGSIYLFGLDTYGNTLFSGDPYSQWFWALAPELNDYLDGPFGGRDVVSVGDAFGESFLYYSTRNPATGMLQRKVTFVKRTVAYGVPILIGAGYYLDDVSEIEALKTAVVAALNTLVAELVAERPADAAAYTERLRVYLEAHPEFFGSAAALLNRSGMVTSSPYVYRTAEGYATTDLALTPYDIESQTWFTAPLAASMRFPVRLRESVAALLAAPPSIEDPVPGAGATRERLPWDVGALPGRVGGPAMLGAGFVGESAFGSGAGDRRRASLREDEAGNVSRPTAPPPSPVPSAFPIPGRPVGSRACAGRASPSGVRRLERNPLRLAR